MKADALVSLPSPPASVPSGIRAVNYRRNASDLGPQSWHTAPKPKATGWVASYSPTTCPPPGRGEGQGLQRESVAHGQRCNRAHGTKSR